jgi:SAM-dependent methyltransferase
MNRDMRELNDLQTSERFYDERYIEGYMHEWPLAKKQRVYEIISSLGLPAKGEALDFGCGNGVFSEVMQKALPRWKIYGTDISSVAIENAKLRLPNCIFFTPSETGFMRRQYDFLLTHHVLEHVYNLEEMWGQITDFMKPISGMLHIAPCGNAGSFEFELCRLRIDGIDTTLENRFFFEDPGHVRRLTTDRLTAIAAGSGFALAKGLYGNQHYGAVNWITQNGPGFVMMLTEPSKAKTPDGQKQLMAIRRRLVPIAVLRYLLGRVSSFSRKRKTVKNSIGFAVGIVVFPLSKLVDRIIWGRAEKEWRHRKTDPSGSELYLYFTR